MKKAVKKLYEEWEKINLMKIFEVEVLDKRTNEKDYVVFDILFEKHSLIAQHVAMNKQQEKSKKIAFVKITVDPDFSLNTNLYELYDCCMNAILESEFYELTE